MDSTVGRPGAEPLRSVLDALRTLGPMTRAEIGTTAGLSRSTVSSLLADLRRAGLVADVATADRPPPSGRPPQLVGLEPTAGLAIGVDVGRRHLRIVVADLGHRVLAEDTERLDVDGHADETLDEVVRLVDRLLGKVEATRADVLGIGLGIPAPLDTTGRVGSSSILPGWVGRLPAEELEARLGVPVHVDNDANLGALAEALWGAGRESSEVVYVKAATGVGAGIVYAGNVLRGASGTAGEIGHTTIVDNGDLCRCGNRGCLEMYVGGPSLVERLGHSGVSVTSVPDIVKQAADGEVSCVRVLADVGDHLGLSIANLVNLINPQVVVLGGELGLAGELVLASLRARVVRSAVPSAASVVRVVEGVLGDRAEALGAVLLVLREPGPFGERLVERTLAALEV
jgi:predicted NBD/HSP70 family sugar kinase